MDRYWFSAGFWIWFYARQILLDVVIWWIRLFTEINHSSWDWLCCKVLSANVVHQRQNRRQLSMTLYHPARDILSSQSWITPDIDYTWNVSISCKYLFCRSRCLSTGYRYFLFVQVCSITIHCCLRALITVLFQLSASANVTNVVLKRPFALQILLFSEFLC